MKVLFLGLNPKKMGGFDENDLQRSIKKNLRATLTELKEKHGKKLIVLSRMMLGPEFWAIEIANELKIAYTIYIPFAGMTDVWPKTGRLLYDSLISRGKDNVKLSDEEWSLDALKASEERLIKDADEIFTAWGAPQFIDKVIKGSGKPYKSIYPSIEEDANSIPF